MENLDLKRLWEICNILSIKQAMLSEENTYVNLLGQSSSYYNTTFERFLEHYSFRIEYDNVLVFNDDKVAWEDYANDDFSYIPIPILGFGEKELENYIEQSIKIQLEQQEIEKVQEKEALKYKIELLQKQLNNL